MQAALSRTPRQAPTSGNLFRPVPNHPPAPSVQRSRMAVGGGLVALLVVAAGTALAVGRRL